MIGLQFKRREIRGHCFRVALSHPKKVAQHRMRLGIFRLQSKALPACLDRLSGAAHFSQNDRQIEPCLVIVGLSCEASPNVIHGVG